jgi:hypothetical protein
MELLDTDDPKGHLLQKSAHHREQLEDDVKFISERTEKIITNALIIGGSLALTYFLVSRFSGSRTKVRSKTQKIRLVQQEPGEETEVIHEASAPGLVTQIGTALASQATVFLLGLAKEKLNEFMQAQSEKKEK